MLEQCTSLCLLKDLVGHILRQSTPETHTHTRAQMQACAHARSTQPLTLYNPKPVCNMQISAFGMISTLTEYGCCMILSMCARYGLAHTLLTIIFWRNSPCGITAITVSLKACLCLSLMCTSELLKAAGKPDDGASIKLSFLSPLLMEFTAHSD